MKKPWYRKYTFLIVLGVSLALYGNTLSHGFGFDDEYITDNQILSEGISGIPDLFKTRYYDQGKINYGYRPVVHATFAVEMTLWNMNPRIGHAVNLILYALLLYIILKVLLKVFPGVSQRMIWLIVLLYAAYPLHTEVVASLKNRDEILSLLGGFIAVSLLLKWMDNRRLHLLPLAGLAMLLAYWAKPSAVPFVLLAPVVMYLYKPGAWKEIVIGTSVMTLAFLIAHYLPNLYLPKETRRTFDYENPLFASRGMVPRFAGGINTYGYYLKMLVFPYPMRYYYGFDMVNTSGLLSLQFILSLVFHLFLFAVTIIQTIKKRPIALAGWFYLVFLGPYSNAFQPLAGIVAERYLFGASLALAIILAWVSEYLYTFRRKSYKPYMVFLIILMLVYSGTSIARNRDWATTFTLLTTDMPKLDRSVKANDLYASVLILESDKVKDEKVRLQMVNDAIRYYKRAAELNPESFFALSTIGAVYSGVLKDYSSSIPYFIKSLGIKPSDAYTRLSLAYAYQALGDSQKALIQYDSLLFHNPEDVTGMMYKANLLFSMGRLEEAIVLDENAYRVDTRNYKPLTAIGDYLLKTGDTSRAILYYNRSLEIYPENDELRTNIYFYYISKGDSLNALRYQSR